MARMSGRSGPWGAFLDSSLDRVADAAIFAGLVLWFLGAGDDRVWARSRCFASSVADWSPISGLARRALAFGPRAESRSVPNALWSS